MPGKSKILILMGGSEPTRNFIETNSFSKVEKFYDVTYLHRKTYVKDHHLINKPTPMIRKLLFEVFVFRASRYCITFKDALSTQGGRPRKRVYFYNLFRFRWVYNLLISVLESFIPIDKRMVKKVKELSPDLILMPISSLGPIALDLVKIAKMLKITLGIIPTGWDNITSKLYCYYRPDFVLERGAQNVDYVRKILEMEERKVLSIGVPQYEMYFQYQQRSDLRERRQRYLNEIGISPDKDVILFGGALRVFDEMSFLEQLEAAISRGIFKKLHIIYRPHPDREKRLKEKSFFDCNFKHITFDEELRQAYMNHFDGGGGRYTPKLDNYPDLFNAVCGIICPPTSLMMEAAVFGKPVLGLVCDDGVHYGWTSVQMIIKREHLVRWKNYEWFVQCHSKEGFIDDCKKLIELSKSPHVREKIKKDMSKLVHYDDNEYAQRLLNALISQID